MHGIQFKIQFEHVDAWLPQKIKLPPLGVASDNRAQFRLADVPLASNTRYLKLSRGRGDIRVETRARGGHKIDGNRHRRVLRMHVLHIAVHTSD